MYHVSIETHFSAAHHLRNYNGHCENLHGHNWKVEVTVSTEQLDEAGMALDFTILKKKTTALIEQLDHHNLNDIPPFTTINPSSENIARYVAQELAQRLADPKIKISRVTAWESDNACATYYP